MVHSIDAVHRCATKAQASENVTWWRLSASYTTLRHVVWLHVPKSGSGFANLLFRGACSAEAAHPFLEPVEVTCIVRMYCPDAFRAFDWGHAPLQQPLLPSTMAVTLVRTPWRRALSGFFANMHSCQWLQANANMTDHRPLPATAPFYSTYRPAYLRAYATCISGCATRMLTGHICGGGQRAVAGEAKLAPQALATLRKFAFVGVTDEWNRSLHAFRRAFAVPIRESDSAIRRRGARPKVPGTYERAEATFRAMRFTDEPLYVEALRILTEIERGTWPPSDIRQHEGSYA